MHQMAEGNNLQVFLETFQATAEACQWLATEWALWLLPLLSGGSPTASLSLPPTCWIVWASPRSIISCSSGPVETAVTLAEEHLAMGAEGAWSSSPPATAKDADMSGDRHTHTSILGHTMGWQ